MEVIINDYDRRRVDAAKQVADLVGATLGPLGQNVDIHHSGENPFMLRDGYRVLQEFKPKGSILSAVLVRMRQAILNNARGAGDATTSTTLMMAACYEQAIAQIEYCSKSGAPISRREVAASIRKYADLIIAELQANTTMLDIDNPVEFDLIRNAITLAGGNMPFVGEAFANLLKAVGPDGSIIPEVSPDIENITWETRPGYRLDNGLISSRLLPPGMSSVRVPDPYVVLVRNMVATQKELSPIIERWKKVCRDNQAIVPLVLICGGITADARATMIERLDDKRQLLPWYTVQCSQDATVWEDMGAIVGVTPVGEGRTQMHKDLVIGAQVPNVVLSKTECTINPYAGMLEDSGLVSRIEKMVAEGTKDEKKAAKARIARLRGLVGVIRVPAETHARMSWIAEVLDDAHKAGVSIINHGVSTGSGVSLIRAGEDMNIDPGPLPLSVAIGYSAVRQAVGSIAVKLLTNGGVPSHTAYAIVDAILLDNPPSPREKYVPSAIDLSQGSILKLLEFKDGVDHLDCFVDPFEHGILDSTQALTDAVRTAFYEAADWVETAIGIIPNAFKEAKEQEGA